MARVSEEEERSSKPVGAAETSKEHAEWHRFQQENLNILGLPKKREWPQCHRGSSWQVRQSCLSRALDHEVRVKVSESESMGEEEWTPQ